MYKRQVEIRKVSSRTLVGSSPANIRHFMELRGIGIVNARRLFGMGAIKITEKIDLVIKLEPWDSNKFYDRTGMDVEYAAVSYTHLHGYPHANTENMNDPIYGDKDFWPGWHTFPLVAGAWGSRQPYWEDVHVLSDYIARSQAVLQNGTAKMDIAIFDTDAYNAQTPNGAENGRCV